MGAWAAALGGGADMSTFFLFQKLVSKLTATPMRLRRSQRIEHMDESTFNRAMGDEPASSWALWWHEGKHEGCCVATATAKRQRGSASETLSFAAHRSSCGIWAGTGTQKKI